MAAEVVTQLATAARSNRCRNQPFYIPMTGPAARPRRSLKHDDTFIVLDSHGDIGASAGGPDGLFNADTRYLARLEMVLDDMQPLLLGSNLRDDNSALTVDLTNSDVYRNGRIVLQKDTLHIVRTIFLWRGTAYQRIGLQNHGDLPASFDLTLLFDNDFADLFEVRGERRPRRGIGSARLLGPADVVLEYSGLDGQSRITALHFDPRPTRLAVNSATYHFDLAPQQVTSLFIAVSCNRPIMQKPVPFFRGLLAHRREMRRSTAGRRQHRNLQRHLQRGAVPGDGRPQHADDGYAAGPISLCRHSLVLDDVRPRRPDHGACRCCGSIRASRAACCSGWRSFRPEPSIRSPTPSPEKSCTRCAAAKWRRCAKCRSRSITAASIRRRCSCCWPASMSSAPATTKRSPNCGLRSKRRCAGSTAPAIPIGDGFVEYRRATEQGLANQGWKDSLRRDLPCRRTPRRRLYRACRSAGLCIRRQAAGGALRLAARALTDKAGKLEAEAQRACRALRGSVLVRGTRHLCAGARRRQTAMPGAHLECRTAAVHRHRRVPIAPGWSPPD